MKKKQVKIKIASLLHQEVISEDMDNKIQEEHAGFDHGFKGGKKKGRYQSLLNPKKAGGSH